MLTIDKQNIILEIPLSLHLLPMGKVCLEYIYTYKLLKDKVKCKNIRLTLKYASITTMTTDFYSVSVLSNKLELFISRVNN